MTSISIEALEGKTVGEILQIEKQVPNLPQGFKMKYKPVKIKTAQELVEELE